MRATHVTLALLAGSLVSGAGRAEPEPMAPRPGDVVFTATFEEEAERAAWSEAPFAEWLPGSEGNVALRVTVAAEAEGGAHMIHLPFDVTPYRGCRLLFECRGKAEGVTEPPAPYLGVKYMLHYGSESRGPQWHNQAGVFGTFDWKTLSFTVTIATDASEGDLSLGLQESTGIAWFDDLRVTVLQGPPPARPAPPVDPPPAFRGHALPRLRGVMSPNRFAEEDLRVLGMEWNANVIRWQITRAWGQPGTDRDLAEYDAWLAGRLDELDRALEACLRYGLLVVIDMHSPPGGRYENNDVALFHEPLYQDHFVALWEEIARRYRGHPAVWGYDLINEPVQSLPSPPGVEDYLGAQVRAAKAIRAIDPDTPIFLEAREWDSAAAFAELTPVDVPNVIYQVHMYEPGAFTHQGVHSEAVGIAYPGTIAGQEWDKDRIRRWLAPVREFQLAYNVHIYVGEFSAIRWAPGAADYLRDCIEVFEEYGWDWTYHAYREWDGWSLEHGSDRDDHEPTAEPTDRKQLLLSWFARNEKPRR